MFVRLVLFSKILYKKFKIKQAKDPRKTLRNFALQNTPPPPQPQTHFYLWTLENIAKFRSAESPLPPPTPNHKGIFIREPSKTLRNFDLQDTLSPTNALLFIDPWKRSKISLCKIRPPPQPQTHFYSWTLENVAKFRSAESTPPPPQP